MPASLPSVSSSVSSPTSSSTLFPSTLNKKRPIPRKGHTKSRKGCLNCKRRKVKCEETLPECNHCRRIGLRCEYPSSSTSAFGVPPSQPTSALTPIQTITPGATFTLSDLRLFQHFLLKAYPPLPLGGESVWQGVAQMSHEFEYLVHSMLGLAASSLALTSSSSSSATSFSQSALSHRVRAIHLLNASLSNPCVSQAEGTARYAAVMALTFQSSYMDDGMLEFVAMMRGCHVMAQAAMDGSYAGSVLGAFSREGHVEAVRMLGPAGPQGVGKDMLDGCLVALRELRLLCTGMLEGEIVERVERIVGLAGWDCLDAFDKVTGVYELLGTSDHADFSAFVDAANWAAQIVLVYFFLVEYAIAYYAMGAGRSPFAYRVATNRLWVENLVKRLPEGYKTYMNWPLEFVKTLPVI